MDEKLQGLLNSLQAPANLAKSFLFLRTAGAF
jgi:hypothetical protein